MKKFVFFAVLLMLSSPVKAQESAERIRSALAGALGGTICAPSAVWAGWCAVLGIEAAYWVNEGVSLAIDRHFKAEDQKFANEHGVTICYSDATCITPK